MEKTYEDAQRDLDISIRFVCGEKDCIELNDFIELHRNIYYVQPKENLTNFMNVNNVNLDDI
jgi:hypothetical protein